ncbi:MAG TPA: hypothetical protein VGK50_03835 [Coriobacteriia bacterium]|jgi:hypothetical protein
MSTQTIKLLIAGALLLHGLGHGGAIAALLYVAYRPDADSGDWTAARSWLFPSLAPATARIVASAFWIVSLVGFVAAAMSFWGVLVPGEMWRQIAVVSSAVSLTGIVLFAGNWPTFNTLAASAMNVAVLVTQLWTHWPAQTMFGK